MLPFLGQILNNILISENWTCNFDEFKCPNANRCIPLSWKCDGKAQCPEGTDEYNCHHRSCADSEFHCTEQDTCIYASWRCDGVSDCMGNEDEKLCGKFSIIKTEGGKYADGVFFAECAVDQFKCSTGGGCIPSELRCDGVENCPDLSDEWGCLRNHMSNDTEADKNNTYLEVRQTFGRKLFLLSFMHTFDRK